MKTLLLIGFYKISERLDIEVNYDNIDKLLADNKNYKSFRNHPRTSIDEDGLYYYDEDFAELDFIINNDFDPFGRDILDLWVFGGNEIRFDEDNIVPPSRAIRYYKEDLENYYKKNQVPEDIDEWIEDTDKIVLRYLQNMIDEIKGES